MGAACALPAAAEPLGSGIEPQYFDTSVRIQDDLYRAVNGKWLDTVEIPKDQAWWGTFTILHEKTQNDLHSLIEGIPATAEVTGSKKRVHDLYASFMDEAHVEQLAGAPLAQELAQIDAIGTRAEVIRAFALEDALAIDTPLGVSVHLDNRDATRYIVDIEQGGLGLPDRDYYLDAKDARFADVRKRYVSYIGQILGLAGAPDAERAAPRIMAFETAVARISWDRVKLRDPIKAYNKYPLEKLPRLAPGLPWSELAKGAGYEGKVDYLIIGQPTYVAALQKLVQKTPLADLKAYLKLRLVNQFAPYLSKSFVDAHFAFNGTVLNGVPAQRDRWKRAIRLVDSSIGDDLGQAYVAQYFPPERKARMEALVGNLIAAFSSSIDTLDWMGTDTKAQAHTKLGKLMVKIGYPKKPVDYTALEVRPDDLLGNVLRARRFEFQRQINKLGKPVDRDEWGMTAQTINAYFNPELNEIVFPAAILQPPFFDAEADDAVNYGAIGAIIGHEISHGFDDQGSQYDGDGNLRDWWTPADHAAFIAKTKRLIAQYDAFSPLPGYHVNGALTLGENIADNSGLAIAYKAYLASLGGVPAPVMDGLTGEQRFYYGWARAWRSKSRDPALIAQIKSDPHSPDPDRADGSVRNQPGFYQAFGVKPGDKLYLAPDARVLMW